MSTFFCVTWPSSSTFRLPRRSGMVPSSSTVTPLAATRWPTRPLKVLLPLRLKSPSRPWPTASCSSTPGQPEPSTTAMSPAGRRAAVEVGERGRHGVVDVAVDDGVGEVAQAEAATAAAGADLALHLAGHGLLGDHGHVQAYQRAHVGGAGAVGAGHQHHVVLGAHAGHHLHDGAGPLARGELLHLLQQRHLLRAVQRGDGVGGGVEHAALRGLGLRGDLDAPVLARGGDGAHGARGASSSDSTLRSSLYANAVFSPATARTPTPWSMLKLPLLTMPSSRLQPSWRVVWK